MLSLAGLPLDVNPGQKNKLCIKDKLTINDSMNRLLGKVEIHLQNLRKNMFAPNFPH